MRLLFLLLVLASPPLVAHDLLFVNATVIPDPDLPALPQCAILVRDGRIAAVGPQDQLTIPAGVEIIDCTGRFITAGFWNCHVHLITPDLLRAREAPAAQLDETLMAMFALWGFTTIFDLASSLENTVALRERIEAGEVSGPRILTAGEALWTRTPVYVLDYFAAHNIQMPAVTTAEEITRRIGEHAGRGADGIKLFTGSMQARGAVDNMGPELVRTAVAEELGPERSAAVIERAMARG